MMIGADARTAALRTIVRNRLPIPSKPTASWVILETMAFADRQAEIIAGGDTKRGSAPK
jgi:hypothetical protein